MIEAAWNKRRILEAIPVDCLQCDRLIPRRVKLRSDAMKPQVVMKSHPRTPFSRDALSYQIFGIWRIEGSIRVACGHPRPDMWDRPSPGMIDVRRIADRSGVYQPLDA
ncbi:MAG: hypothetical protein NVSMB22_17920 [Chloroflexota bacterium]